MTPGAGQKGAEFSPNLLSVKSVSSRFSVINQPASSGKSEARSYELCSASRYRMGAFKASFRKNKCFSVSGLSTTARYSLTPAPLTVGLSAITSGGCWPARPRRSQACRPCAPALPGRPPFCRRRRVGHHHAGHIADQRDVGEAVDRVTGLLGKF